jgi:hypothetical protein
MPSNTAPIFTGTPRVGIVTLPAVAATAQVNSQGTGTIGTNMFLAFSAGANGSYLQKVRFNLTGTANNASTAGILRVYVSTQSSGATSSSNTWLVNEVTAASQTPNVTTGSAALYPIDVPLNFPIPTGYNVLVGVSTVSTVASAPVWVATSYGGDY